MSATLHEAVFERATILVSEALGVELSAISKDTGIGEVEAWDSIGHLRIIMAIESEIGGELKSEELVEIMGVSDIAVLLERYKY